MCYLSRMGQLSANITMHEIYSVATSCCSLFRCMESRCCCLFGHCPVCVVYIGNIVLSVYELLLLNVVIVCVICYNCFYMIVKSTSMLVSCNHMHMCVPCCHQTQNGEDKWQAQIDIDFKFFPWTFFENSCYFYNVRSLFLPLGIFQLMKAIESMIVLSVLLAVMFKIRNIFKLIEICF